MATSSEKSGRTYLSSAARNPGRLRLSLTVLMLVIAYFAVGAPLTDRIAAQQRRLQQEQNRRQLGQQLETMEAQLASCRPRIPETTDDTEWVQYVIDGVRGFPVELVNLEPGETQRIGPLSAVTLQLELQGEIQDLDAFLEWLETNERLFRIDSVRVEMARRESAHSRLMKLVVLGLKA
jgi:type II secretory pathway component PulM